MGITKIISVGVAILILAGCAPQYAWEGTWKGERNLPLRPGVSDSVRRTAAKIDLKILPNGTFEIFESGLPKSGHTVPSNGKLVLRVENIMDRPIEKPMEFTLTNLAPTRIRFEDGSGEAVVLNLEAQPAR